MHLKWKKYLLTFSLLASLIAGGIYMKLQANQVAILIGPVVSSSEDLVIPRDIKIYTESAAMIVVGNVKDVVNHPNTTDTPYPRTILDAQIEVSEVIKGDPEMTSIAVTMIASSENSDTEDEVILMQGEKVLLFLGTNGEGNTVVFAGPNGKYLIDGNNNVSSSGGFEMSLSELKAQIKDFLPPDTLRIY